MTLALREVPRVGDSRAFLSQFSPWVGQSESHPVHSHPWPAFLWAHHVAQANSQPWVGLQMRLFCRWFAGESTEQCLLGSLRISFPFGPFWLPITPERLPLAPTPPSLTTVQLAGFGWDWMCRPPASPKSSRAGLHVGRAQRLTGGVLLGYCMFSRRHPARWSVTVRET